MQFVYLVFKLDLRATKDYDRNKVDLPSRSFGAVTKNIWIQTGDPGDPGNAKSDKAENTDYTAVKLEIMFGDKKILPKFFYQLIGQQVRHAGHALFFYWWHEKSVWCHFRVIWHDWRNHKFTHSLTVNKLLSSSLFSLRL